MEKKMYTIQVVAPREHSVARSIADLIATKKWEDHIGRVLIPERKVIEVRNNKPKTVMQRMYPGYIFIEIEEGFDDAFVNIRRLNNVINFVGVVKNNNTRPSAMSAREVQAILDAVEKANSDEVQAKHEFQVGQKIRILKGSFTDFTGEIATIDVKRDVIKVTINVFNRPVDVEFTSKEIEME